MSSAARNNQILPSGSLSANAAVIASGRVRKGRRTKELVKRLAQGDVAVINHADLDAIAAQTLVDCKPVAVINTSRPITGRYPNRGPRILSDARIAVLYISEKDGFDRLEEGASAIIRANGAIEQRDGVVIESSEIWSRARIDSETALARRNLKSEIQRFADNTLGFLRDEAEAILEPAAVADLLGVPNMDKRQVVVVVRGEGYKDDLNSIRGYIADLNPVLIGVDGGADALLDAGLKPHIILGDMDSVSDRGLRCGAKLIVQGYASSGDAPGLARLTDLGLSADVFRVPGTSEDAALLLAYEKGAELIVAVGTHSNLEDFLDKGRAGMASTFLTRLKVGSPLVDARGVSRLHQPRLGVSELAALALSALFVVLTLMDESPFGRLASRMIRLWWRLTLVNLQHLMWHVKLR